MDRKKLLWALGTGVALLCAGGAGYYYYAGSAGKSGEAAEKPGGRRGPPGAGRPQPVTAVAAKNGEIDVQLNAIGTVTARNTVTVRPRVDGQLVRVLFREGQNVKAGEVLAEIDPRPFQVVLDQASGQLARDQAQLTNAVVDLQRYQVLAAKDSIARQQLDAQDALVRQYQGAVQADRAAVESAKLQLSFTRVSAPAAGRTGLRQVDVGNMVRSSDTTGIVVITQTQPINIVFAIPADSLDPVHLAVQQGKTLAVDAWDRENRKRLATGKLLTLDNQIDTATGTVKLKAEFDNADNALFPNQFVNVRLKVDTRKDAVVIPTAAVQRGTQGTYVYVVVPGDEKTIALRPITLGPSTTENVAVDKGLAVGEQVVTDGADKLRPGAKVEVITAESRAAGRGAGEGANRAGKRDGAPRTPAAAPPAGPPGAKAAAEVGNPVPPKGESQPQNAQAAPSASPAPSAQSTPPPVAGDSAGERPRWLDRLPPEVQEKVMKMTPEERREWIQKRREERAARQADGGN